MLFKPATKENASPDPNPPDGNCVTDLDLGLDLVNNHALIANLKLHCRWDLNDLFSIFLNNSDFTRAGVLSLDIVSTF